MALYFITYDLRKKRNYQDLYDELDKFNAVKILESTWCFKKFRTSAEELIDHFISYIDSDDGIVISEVNDWATFNTDGNPEDL